MSFLQSLRNRERLLRWFDEVDFQRQLSNFHQAHASKFAHYEEGGPCDHSWHGLHQEYRRLYEDHLQQFLSREGMKQKEFVMLAGRYAKDLSGQEAEEWDAFLLKLTSCEEFREFLETMKAVATGLPASVAGAQPEDDPSSPSRRVPAAVVAFAHHLCSSARRRDLEMFVQDNWCTFHVRFQEHRHEWYSLHQKFALLFELAAEEAMLAAKLEIGRLADFLVHQLPLMGSPESLQDFLCLLSPAEDYVAFVEMMKATAAEFSSPLAQRAGLARNQAQPSAGLPPEPPPAPAVKSSEVSQVPPPPPPPPPPPTSPPDSRAVSPSPGDQRLSDADLANTSAVRESFRAFLDAGDAPESIQRFNAVLGLLNQTRPLRFHAFAAVLGPLLDRPLRGLLDCIDKRLSEQGSTLRHGRYSSQQLWGVRCAICGAGPVGLRCALELRALGAEVSIFEKRRSFDRLNRLKLWEWVKHDLIGWGARQLMPKFGAGAGHLHIGIAQLQLLLLKTSLLLGVDVQLGTALSESSGEEGAVLLARPTEEVPFPVLCDVLVEAGGPRSLVWSSANLQFDLVGTAKATGLVANFRRSDAQGEDLAEFSWASQFNKPLFTDLKDKVQADLENIVYLRGEEAHYFVMTPKMQSLVDAGILATPATPFQEADEEALRRLARGIASYFRLPAHCDFAARPQLFDFSKRRSCETALVALPAQSQAPLLLAVVGDALLEPFWPEGLGITRGFLGCLDTCWQLSELCFDDFQAARLAGVSEPLADCCERRSTSWRLLKQIGAANQTEYLLPEEHQRSYALNPKTRYKSHWL